MKTSLPQKIYLRVQLYLARRKTKYKTQLKEGLEKLKVALSQERAETRQMFEIYLRQAQGEASNAEIAAANKQFRDVLKGLGLGVVLVLPFSPITLPLIVRLGDKMGVDVLPDSFRKMYERD